MTCKFKSGDKVWVKARVVSSHGVGDDEVVVRIRTSFGESTIGVVPSEDVIRDASPWQPIEGAPKDGTLLFLRDAHGTVFVGRWFEAGKIWESACVKRHPTHYMPIPPLEVE